MGPRTYHGTVLGLLAIAAVGSGTAAAQPAQSALYHGFIMHDLILGFL